MCISFHQPVELINIRLLDGADAIDGEVAIGTKLIAVGVEIRSARAAIFYSHQTARSDVERLCLTTRETKTDATQIRHALAIAATSHKRMHAHLAYDERLITILTVLSGDFLYITHEREITEEFHCSCK